ncbi:MAG: DUF4914 domain-containing protein [Thermoanaerobacterium thermosaccharolyticum]|jgi:hypothetical protein
MEIDILNYFILPDEVLEILKSGKEIIIPESREELLNLTMGGGENDTFEVSYDVPGRGKVVEATVAKCKNGFAINYPEPYMRRREPNCMVIADDKDTDKVRYKDRFGEDFEPLRVKTFQWLKEQDLIVMPFMAGDESLGYASLVIAPKNAGFFVLALADIQGFIPKDKINKEFKPLSIIFVAPPFRHTHFGGKQVVVHNRLENMQELFSYNLYPGPSAKKGVYSVLLDIGEREGWITAHASTVRVITPYDNIMTIMHEGASGGGKSEMTEQLPRELDGRIHFGTNIVTKEKFYMELKENSELQPVTDDMALCHPIYQDTSKKLVVKDAENGWFIRLDHVTEYGSSPDLEKLCIHPKEPLLFLNIVGVPNSTCLIWEHIEDSPGKPCTNPRVIMPRGFISNTVDEAVEVDIRSFGVRTPPCTKENPSYGILGLLHVLPPSIAWLWRLVAPRGYANPSIIDTEGLSSEGVGSYWPFATGKMVRHANLILDQIQNTPATRYVLIPNQHIGAYKVGFMPQWIAREYLSRRGGAKFRPDQLTKSKCPLLGYSLESLKIDGEFMPKHFLQVYLQPEVGEEAFQRGAKILTDFFKQELKKYLTPDLSQLGKKIIECCLDDGTLDDYINLL